MNFSEAQVLVEITDHGQGFEPAEIPPPDIDAPMSEREPGGLGWFLIQKVMDEVTYTRTGNVNRLNLTKRIHS